MLKVNIDHGSSFIVAKQQDFSAILERCEVKKFELSLKNVQGTVCSYLCQFQLMTFHSCIRQH